MMDGWCRCIWCIRIQITLNPQYLSWRLKTWSDRNPGFSSYFNLIINLMWDIFSFLNLKFRLSFCNEIHDIEIDFENGLRMFCGKCEHSRWRQNVMQSTVNSCDVQHWFGFGRDRKIYSCEGTYLGILYFPWKELVVAEWLKFIRIKWMFNWRRTFMSCTSL